MANEAIKWHLERMSDENQKHGIIKLRQRTFTGEDLDKEQIDFWNWEFKDNYAGPAKIFLAVDEDKIVGHYAVCPSKIKVGSDVKAGSIVVDVMTDPDYRYQGMFTKLGKFSLDESGKDGVEFSYGFPIRKSVMPGHLKVGWKIAFPLPVYVYPTNFCKIIKKFLKVNVISFLLAVIPTAVYELYGAIRKVGLPKFLVKSTKKFDDTESLRQFIDRTANQHKVIQPRDFEFLDWRFNQNEYRDYTVLSLYDGEELKGYITLRDSRIYDLDCVTIIDIQALNCDKKITRQLLSETRKYAKAKKVALIGCMINNNDYKKQMLSEGYIKSPYIFKMIIHENESIDYMDTLMKNENWYLTWGDTDDL